MSTWGDIEDKVSRLVGSVPALTKGVGAAADLVSARRELRRVASPSAVADRLKALKATIESESDKLLTEIDGVASTGVKTAFDKGRAFLAAQRADLSGLEAELAQLTNLPLDGSTTS